MASFPFMDFSQDWSRGISGNFDPAEAVPQFKQHLYENWKRGDGPCARCPNRLFKESCEPSFGSGTAEADILLVGSSPGPRARSLEQDNKSRVVNPARLDALEEFEGHALCTFYNRDISDIHNWQGFSTLRKRFIEDQRGLDSDLESGRFYFTNAKKCCNIEGADNGKALQKCGECLSREIELVNPDVVISWGMQAAKESARSVGYDTSGLPNRTMSLPAGDLRPTNSVIGFRDTTPRLITMPHWAFLGPNLRHIPGFDPANHDSPASQLYFQLAELVNYLIEND